MYKQLTFILILLICFSCDNEVIEKKVVPDNVEIDLNQDGLVDFQIIYEKLSVVAPIDPDPGPVELIRGKLVSLNGDQILKSEETTSILFLNDINLVRPEVNTPLFWESSSGGNSSILVAISQNFDRETWPDEWSIANDEIKDSYLLGFKLLNNNDHFIGYIELSINNQSGQVEIIDIEFI